MLRVSCASMYSRQLSRKVSGPLLDEWPQRDGLWEYMCIIYKIIKKTRLNHYNHLCIRSGKCYFTVRDKKLPHDAPAERGNLLYTANRFFAWITHKIFSILYYNVYLTDTANLTSETCVMCMSCCMFMASVKNIFVHLKNTSKIAVIIL